MAGIQVVSTLYACKRASGEAQLLVTGTYPMRPDPFLHWSYVFCLSLCWELPSGVSRPLLS